MRDRSATEQRILHAVGRVLAREGFRGFGLRPVAREAGVDKRLIHRYFGGVEGLVRAYAASADHWWTVDELVGDHLPPPRDATPAGWFALAMKRHAQAIRKRPVTQEILVWELTERNALTDQLAEIREQRARELTRRLAEKMGPSGHPSQVPIGAILVAATTYFVLRARTFDYYAGFHMKSDAGWRVIEQAIDAIATCTIPNLGQGTKAGPRPRAKRPARRAASHRSRRGA